MNYSANNKKIAERKKGSKGQDPCTELIEENVGLDKQIQEAEKVVDETWDKLIKLYRTIGNLVHETVPIDDNEDNNKVEKTWGEVQKVEIDGTPGRGHHHEVLHWIGGYDRERGTKISGQRGYFLTGYGVILNQALLQYGLHFLMKRGYTPVQPPYFMKQEVMGATCQLSDFDDQLYKYFWH